MLANQGSTAKIVRPTTLRESVLERILELIIIGSLKPGQHLVENELADNLGVSRQPVREALQLLSGEGWVDLRPGHGAYVHSPTVEEADQLLAVRTLLEAESARLAARNPDKSGVSTLRDICLRGLEACVADDVDAAVAANSELHTAVVNMSGNRVLADLTSQVARRVRWYHTPVARHRGKASWEEHAALIDAIEAGEEDVAADIMRRHTEHTRQSYLESRAQHPEVEPPAPIRRRRPRAVSS
ncbi:GntR family transcriptional regulator [Herbidospora cretacea]|uniref:GntR family transcriptional regulator n=1 Tax=Herbidospora cretacea TaxID=28444 RepID=UPI000774BA6E|nr:GntR family transcriptional regulator [Herbidospora cretacea]